MKINKKTGLRMFNIEYVREKGPCYKPERYLKSNVRYSAISILQDGEIPFADRLWVVLRTELVSEKLMRLFAVWSARQVQHLMKHNQSINALNVAESFALGVVTKEELAAAWAAAWAAVSDAVSAAASAAAWAAASDAVSAAASAAAWAAASDAASDAASAATRAAARAAAWAAASDAASDAARAAAWAAAQKHAEDRQCDKLISMILVEANERLNMQAKSKAKK